MFKEISFSGMKRLYSRRGNGILLFMCLVVPLKVKSEIRSTKSEEFLMEDGRMVKSLVKNVKVVDYLICQQDLGIEKVSKDKAQLIRNALRKGIPLCIKLR